MGTHIATYRDILKLQSGAAALICLKNRTHWLNTKIECATPDFLKLITSYTQKEPLFHPLGELVPGEFHTELSNLFKSNQSREIRISKAGTTYFYFACLTQLEKTDKQSYVVLHLHDITEKRRADEEKHKDSVMLRALIETLPDNIYMKNRQSEFLICNQSTAETLQAPSATDIIGKTDADFLPPRSATQSRLDEERIFQTGKAVTHKEECLEDEITGQQKWTLTTKVPLFDQDQNIIGLVGIGRDITESRAQEQLLRKTQSMLHLATTLSPLLFGYFDIHQKLLYANASFCRWNDLQEDQIPYLKENSYNLRDILESQSYLKIMPQIEQCLLGQKAQFSGSFQFADGQDRCVNMNLIPTRVRDGSGTIDGFYLFAIDVSELDAARTEAEMASHAKSQFLANMSHELRTPLNAILGFSEIMRGEAFGPLGNSRYIGYMKDIHDSGRHLLDVINDILDLSKIEAGKMELDFQQVSPIQAINTATSFVQGRAYDQSITLEKDISETLPEIKTDLRALKQILINLLANAIKFTPEGGSVCLSAKTSDQDFIISIRDNGVGMSKEQVEKVGEAFTQFRNKVAETRSLNGTGLGLYITKALLQQMSGEFEIASQKGVGTIVTIKLPLQESSSEVLKPEPQTQNDKVIPLKQKRA